jgi:hypothetical protein
MRCVFCKSNSDASVSEEHIIPESLGNVDHVLPRGWVCDGCNNYIALKVEKPFLETFYGKSSRAIQEIPSKKGRIPPRIGFHPKSRTEIEIFRDPDGSGWCVGAAEGEDERRWVESFLNMPKGEHGYFWMPDAGLPEADYTTSRFIAKIGFEALVSRCLEIKGWNDEIVDKLELDELRRYVRFGSPNKVWPINVRQIYSPDFHFVDEIEHKPHEKLHEFMIHHIPSELGGEYYAVIAIFGVEYSINLGGQELEGYQTWLKQHGGRSPLLDAVPRT